MRTIDYPEGFRFRCDIDKFKKCVDIAKKMLDSKQLSILFGCVSEVKVKIWIDEKQFTDTYHGLGYQEFKDILFDEISVILEQNLVMPDLEEPSLKEYLDKNVEDADEREKIVNEKYEKRKYVIDKLMSSETDLRYLLKKKTLLDKLYDIDYELNSFLFEDKSDMIYSTIRIETSETLNSNSMPGIFAKRPETKSVCFVCDKQDLEYIINTLEKIRERM